MGKMRFNKAERAASRVSPGGVGGGGGGAGGSHAQRLLAQVKVSSDPLFQQLLYYQVWLSLIYWCSYVYIMDYKTKLELAAAEERVTTIVIFTLWSVVEPIRLLAGYSGNLQEKVPSLLVFGVMTLFPQVFVYFFLGYAQTEVLQVEKALNLVCGAFLVPQFFGSMYVTNVLIKGQSERFYLQEIYQPIAPPSHSGRSRREAYENY